MSPGRRPRPSLESQGHASPARSRSAPITINARCILDILLQVERAKNAKVRGTGLVSVQVGPRRSSRVLLAGGAEGQVLPHGDSAFGGGKQSPYSRCSRATKPPSRGSRKAIARWRNPHQSSDGKVVGRRAGSAHLRRGGRKAHRSSASLAEADASQVRDDLPHVRRESRLGCAPVRIRIIEDAVRGLFALDRSRRQKPRAQEGGGLDWAPNLPSDSSFPYENPGGRAGFEPVVAPGWVRVSGLS
jgi:hypothetical protein